MNRYLAGCFLLASQFANASEVSSGMSNLAYVKVFFALVFVIFLMMSLAWGLKKSQLIGANNEVFKVVAQMPLGTKEKLAIIEIQGEQMVIGVTPSNINFIKSLDHKVEVTNTQTDFAALLSEKLEKVIKKQG